MGSTKGRCGVCAGEGGAGTREKRMDYGVRRAASFGNRVPSLGLSEMGTMAAPTPQGCSGTQELFPYCSIPSTWN